MQAKGEGTASENWWFSSPLFFLFSLEILGLSVHLRTNEIPATGSLSLCFFPLFFFSLFSSVDYFRGLHNHNRLKAVEGDCFRQCRSRSSHQKACQVWQTCKATAPKGPNHPQFQKQQQVANGGKGHQQNSKLPMLIYVLFPPNSVGWPESLWAGPKENRQYLAGIHAQLRFEMAQKPAHCTLGPLRDGPANSHPQWCILRWL